MNLLHNRLRFVSCATVLLLSLVAASCSKNTTTTMTPPDARAELLASLKDANLDGFVFETRDNDAQEVVSMTNSIVGEAIKMDGDTTLVLRYSMVKDKKANTSTTYRIEATRAGDQLTFQVTDIASGASFMTDTSEFSAPPAATGTTCGPPAFKNFDDCLCSLRAALLFEANRTCKPQTGAATCCINGTALVSVHIIAMPTDFRCLSIFGINDLVLFRD
jgi:hypothetical protein